MSAVISECGQYRYLLTREFGDLFTGYSFKAIFVMLNPSTADAKQDDPTIRKCAAFAKTWGYNGIVVANLYALRSTDPKQLWKHPDPVGYENDGILRGLAHKHHEIICAWGRNAKSDRVKQFHDFMVSYGARLLCLGTNKDGSPKHPLYLKNDTQLRNWSL